MTENFKSLYISKKGGRITFCLSMNKQLCYNNFYQTVWKVIKKCYKNTIKPQGKKEKNTHTPVA